MFGSGWARPLPPPSWKLRLPHLCLKLTNTGLQGVSPQIQWRLEAEITVTIALSDYGEGGCVTERLPEGFTFVSSSVQWTGRRGFFHTIVDRVWIELADSGTTNVAYKVTAPPEPGGPFTFTGKFLNYFNESVSIAGASAVTVAAVARTPASYDSNGNGIIELPELFDAIDDYFDGKISLTVLFDIIDFYFSGNRVG